MKFVNSSVVSYRGISALTHIFEPRSSPRSSIMISKLNLKEGVDNVSKVKSKNIDQKNEELVLDLIAIDYLKNKDDYEINLIFNNNAYIALTTETIEVRLEDQNEIKD